MGFITGARAAPLEFVLTKPQLTIFNDPSRFRLVVAGRRFGKTWLARNELIRAALAKKGAHCAYIAPSRLQAKQLLWGPLKESLPQAYIAKKDETGLSLTLTNGSQIFLRGAENETGLKGLGLDFVVLDEAAYIAESVFTTTVRPALSDKRGRALFISTPAGMVSWFYELYLSSQSRPDWGHHAYTTIEGGNVPPEEVEAARRDMDPRIFQQEYCASFESMAGRVYYAFDPKLNVVEDKDMEDIKETETIHASLDFNVCPLVCCITVKRGPEVHVVEEIAIMNGNTEMMAQEIRKRYPKNVILCYPDPTGASRKTSATAGVTDHSILRSHGFSVISPHAPWPVTDKLNNTNHALCDASGYRRLLFKKSKTKEVQRALMGLTFVEGTSIPDPRSQYSHFSDSLSYGLFYTCPSLVSLRRIDVIGA